MSNEPKARPRAGIIERFARKLTDWTGSTTAFVGACAVIVIWGGTGWIFDYGDTWQLVINTGTTIVTFLMVFLIQRSQNKDSLALHLKLNELVAAVATANNQLVNVEDLSEVELRVLHAHYATLAELSRRELDISESHSEKSAGHRHARKKALREARLSAEADAAKKT